MLYKSQGFADHIEICFGNGYVLNFWGANSNKLRTYIHFHHREDRPYYLDEDDPYILLSPLNL